MNTLRIRINAILAYFLASLILLGCTDEPIKESEETPVLKNETPFAYVERDITGRAALMSDLFQEKLTDVRQSPLEVVSPYEFNPGAKLLVRDGLDVNAIETDILAAYFGSDEYDVKNLNVSPDGDWLVFAARGSDFHATDSTWNIFLYNFESKQLKRVIENAFEANSGHDTNPTITLDNKIIFSSDRDAGNPLFPRENIELIGDLCRKVDPDENPSLLHSMSVNGADIIQLTYGRYNHDINPTTLKDGRVAFVRWERSFQSLPSCSLTDKSLPTLSKSSTAFPSGLEPPERWSEDAQCNLAKLTTSGAVLVTNHHKLLTIGTDGQSMEQLYNTVTAESSDESFLAIDKIFQSENGNLFSLIRHQYNPVLGGELVELQPFQQTNSNTVFAELSPRPLGSQTVNLYPGELSDNGWFSAFWPYRDGTSRLLVSWANCTLVNNGVSSFCETGNGQGEQDLQYGIWMFEPNTNSRSPIVRAKDDMVITDIAVAQPHVGDDLSLDPFNPNFVDNEDATRILCNFPNNQPLAIAGPDQSGYLGNSFAFNGNQSSDPDGDPLTYAWSIKSKPNNSVTNLLNETQVNPTFEPDEVGRYEVELVVKDGKLESEPDSLILNVVLANDKPLANAGEDQNVLAGSLVNLNGTGSSDPDGDALTYRWVIVNQPADSLATLNDTTLSNPQFTPDKPGNYVVQLIVNDGMSDSAPDTVNISAGVNNNNNKPVANAGVDQNTAVDANVTLDGSGSRDPDGDSLTYRWSFVSVPNGSSVSLFGNTSANPTFMPNLEGEYVIQLIVNDGVLDSDADVVSVNVVHSNNKPIADAGPDKMTRVDELVTLDGSGSRDPDGDSLNYSWAIISQPGSTNVTLTNPNSVSPTFTPSVEGAYVARLVVGDGQMASAPDTVTITVAKANTKPIADAGIDQTSRMGEQVSLDGSRSSDPDGDPLTYEWQITTQPDGSGVILSDSTSVNPNFVSDKVGEYVFQLVVNDGIEDSEKDMVTVSVSELNGKPVANAGPDLSGEVGASFTPDGSASSDPDGDPLTYQWTLVQLPDGSSAVLGDVNNVISQLTTDVAGTYVVQLVVNDGGLSSEPDLATITIDDPNNRPIANAGPDQHFVIGQTLTLDGSASSDVDGDSLTYQWQVTSPTGSTVVLSDSTAVTPTITLPDNETYVVELVVFDGTDYSSPDTVSLSFNNTKPIANAGPDQTSSAGELVKLDGSASTDVDGDPLTYQWSFVSRPQGSTSGLSDATSVNPEITLDAAGIYQLQLIVNDGYVDSDPDTVVINSVDNTAPVADAGNDQNVGIGDVAILDGSGSFDADNDPLTYQWNLLHKPDSSNAVLQDANTVSPSITADVHGEYVIQLIVNDGLLDSQPDSVMLTSENLRPIADAGDDQVTELGNPVTLDGSGSYDPDGDAISYQWDLLHKPDGSNINLDSSQNESPALTPDKLGTYVAQLIVNDGLLDSLPDTMTIEVSDVPPVCEISNETERTLPVTIRDFTPDHPDFQAYDGIEYGIVKNTLGADGLPQYRGGNGAINGRNRGDHTTTGKSYFDQWYRDTAGVNLNISKTLTIERQSDSTIWEYRNEDFFPINGEGFGNYQSGRNFHFTMETHLEFDYKGGESFTFRGDDDLWLFINGKLAIDIGGVHGAEQRTIDLDSIASQLGIEPNNNYTFDLFFAERHTVKSTFMFQTNMELECVTPK